MKAHDADERAKREERRKFIGGSDAPAVLGLSPWRTPFDLYEEKIAPEGEFPPISEERAKIFRRGKKLEPYVLEMLEEEHGIAAVRRNIYHVHPDHPMIRAEVDAELPDGRTTVEIKTVHPFAAAEWGEQGTDEIPVQYAVQTLHGLMVTNRDRCIVAALLGADDLRVYEVVRNLEVEQRLLERELEFWERVKTRRPPPPMTVQDLNTRYRQSIPRAMEVNDDIAAAVRSLSIARASIKDLEAEEAGYELQVKEALGENDTAIYGGQVIATWRSHTKRLIDGKRLRLERPEIANEYEKPTVVRPLLVKI